MLHIHTHVPGTFFGYDALPMVFNGCYVLCQGYEISWMFN